MKQCIYEDLWRRLSRFAPAEGTEARTEFDGELDRLAGWIAETGVESWPPPGPNESYLILRERYQTRGGTLGPPPQHLVNAAKEEAAARGRA